MVDFQQHGSVAVLTINNPPVNAISSRVRKGIINGLSRAEGLSSVKAIVINGAGRTFPAGADITEFSGMRESGDSVGEGDRHAFLKACESLSKPVVAAIHGTALGGGFELALACHYRVSNPKAQFGFPEVELGILPGWAGTQRLPRLAGLKLALDLIPSGRRLKVAEAVKYGIVDKVLAGDLVKEAVNFAESISSSPFRQRVVSKMQVKDKHLVQPLMEGALIRAKTKSKGMMAPIMCIKAVVASTEGTFEDGVNKESEYSMVLFGSGQARALQYAFFSQRAATKWELSPTVNQNTVKSKPLRNGGVIGAGTMGTGITMCMLNAGMPVVLVEQNQEFLDKGVAILRGLYSQSVKLGKLSSQQMDQCLSLLTPSTKLENLSNVDIVIEAVYENIDVKHDIFKKLDDICQPNAVLCTNTSRISIDKIASVVKQPERVVGTHFFAPAYYMKLLENVRGTRTSPEAIATATAYGLKIGKVPVLVGNCDGFVGNRMYSFMTSEAQFCVEEGAKVEDVDQVLEDFGFPLGVFKVIDLSGLDIGYRGIQDRAKQLGVQMPLNDRIFDGHRFCPIGMQLAHKGRLGRKTGAGWYRYAKAGAKVAYPDDDVTEIIDQYCQKQNITRKTFSTQEILERCLYGLINEGFKVLEEGIAGKPEDIDTIWLLGYAWPRYTGGPMFYANTVGLGQIYERINHYWKEHPTSPHWVPSKLLKRLAEGNIPMKKWASYKSSLSHL